MTRPRSPRPRPNTPGEDRWLIVIDNVFQAHLLFSVTGRDLDAMLTDWRDRCPGPDGALAPDYWEPREPLVMEGQATVGLIADLDAVVGTAAPFVHAALAESRVRRAARSMQSADAVVVPMDAAREAEIRALLTAGGTACAMQAQFRDMFSVRLTLLEAPRAVWPENFSPIVCTVVPYLIMAGSRVRPGASARVFWADIVRVTALQPHWTLEIVADPRVAVAWQHLAPDEALALLSHPNHDVRALAIGRLHGIPPAPDRPAAVALPGAAPAVSRRPPVR